MEKIKGTVISTGIGIGPSYYIESQKFDFECNTIEKDDIANEEQRFYKGIENVTQDIDNLIENFAFTEDDKEILYTHKLILEDPELKSGVQQLIGKELICLEYAIFKHFSKIIGIFENMQNDYYSQRAYDYKEVAQRLLNNLTGKESFNLQDISPGNIIIINEIPASMVSLLSKKGIAGIVSNNTGKACHAAIIARSLSIPVLSGINLCGKLPNGTKIILDALKGFIVVSPIQDTLDHYKKIIKKEAVAKEHLEQIKNLPTETKDGDRILLKSNIEYPSEVDSVLEVNSDGIGLFRTEFMYLNRSEFPAENEQFAVYKKIAEDIYPNPVTIRTIDIGGDKLSSLIHFRKEKNPNLGMRGIRLSLQNIGMFKVQMRAILRASAFGNIKILVPMISMVSELREIKKIINEIKSELDENNILYGENIPLGIMIEIPAAVIIADLLAKECDFFSIGTNDLIQYSLAVDRESKNIESYYTPYHPAILRLINQTVDSAQKAGIDVSVCGEIASESNFIPFLVATGIKELSVLPSLHLKTKACIRMMSNEDNENRLKDLLLEDNTENIENMLHLWCREIIKNSDPEA